MTKLSMSFAALVAAIGLAATPVALANPEPAPKPLRAEVPPLPNAPITPQTNPTIITGGSAAGAGAAGGAMGGVTFGAAVAIAAAIGVAVAVVSGDDDETPITSTNN